MIQLQDIDFNKAVFESDYSFASPLKMKRDAIDAFSKQFCEVEEAEKYSVRYTNGRCFYCDNLLCTVENGVPTFFDIAHDHGIPVAKWGLYTIGNVVISCNDCNSAKSDMDPSDFYLMLVSLGKTTRHKSLEVFECDWKNFQKPYAEQWPDHYKLATEGRPDLSVNEILNNYFLFDYLTKKEAIDFTPQVATRNFDGDINIEIWKALNNLDHEVFDGMSVHSASDIANRINHARSIFKDTFGEVKISDLTEDEFVVFGERLISSRLSSVGESNKLRSLLKTLINIEELAKFAVAFQKIKKRKQLLEDIAENN